MVLLQLVLFLLSVRPFLQMPQLLLQVEHGRFKKLQRPMKNVIRPSERLKKTICIFIIKQENF